MPVNVRVVCEREIVFATRLKFCCDFVALDERVWAVSQCAITRVIQKGLQLALWNTETHSAPNWKRSQQCN